MNWKKVFAYFLSVFFLVIVVFAGWLAYIAFIPPQLYQPETHIIAEQSAYELHKKVGWYKLDDNTEWLLTWRPYGGLLALNFVDFANNNMIPKSKNNFTWYHAGDSLKVTFHDSSGTVNRFSWQDSSGIHHSAVRMNQPYYHQKELNYLNGDILLKGTLLIPETDKIKSAAVIIHGSGTSHRDNFWYLYQAHYFAKHGIMVLLPDKRGSGASGGKWHTASMQDFADDAIAGAREVQKMNMGDSLNLGFVGFSQGGAVAPLAAHKFKGAHFVVNVVGSAVSFNEQLKFEIYNDVRGGGVPALLAPVVTAAYTRRAKACRPIWWKKNGNYNPATYFEKLTVPSLIVYGSEDTNAPVEPSLKNLRAIQQSSANDNITIKVYEGSGHGMGDTETGWIRKEYLNMVVKWIKKNEKNT